MKSLQELNLIDSFIFSCSTENINDAEFIAKLIIKRATGHTIDKVVIESEKQLNGITMDKRGIRMDLCVSEIENEKVARIYDIEPNAYKQTEVFLRSRFYQSHADSKLLDAGNKFYKLPEYISIWILSYDPFGEDRMIYHVKNMVEENPALCYNDGVIKTYLYTGGKIGGSKELKSLLRFFEKSTDDNATDEELKQLLGIVDRIKGSEKVGEQYMVFKSSWDYEFEEELEKAVKEEVEKRIAEEVEKAVEKRVEEEVEKAIEKRVEEEVEKRVEEEVEKAVEKATAETTSKALAEGIIMAMRDFDASDEQIIAALMKKCSLTEDEAREKLADTH